MGLDVTVYVNIKETQDEDSYDFRAYVLDDRWLDRISELKNGAMYKGERVFTFGYSYSSHTVFRRNLIDLVNRPDLLSDSDRSGIDWEKISQLTPQEQRELPFYKLIWFADNEGCMDWKTSIELLNDFRNWQREAEKELDVFDYKRYLDWMKAFILAIEGVGVLVFS